MSAGYEVPVEDARDRAKPIRLALVAVAILLCALAALLVGASFASYASVEHRLDAYASDGDAGLGPERFRTIVLGLRLAAVALVLAGALAVAKRRRLAAAFALLGEAIAGAAGAGRLALGRALARESRLHLAALAAIVAGAAIVRVDFLFQPMRYDESGTFVHYASEPLYIGLTSYTAPNNHLFHTLLVHLSYLLFGNEPWAIRLPALVAGILLVPATYLASRLLFDRHAALLAAGLVAASSRLIEYSTNARGYTILTLVFVLLLAAGIWLARTSDPAAAAAVAVLGAIGFYTIPVMLYAYGAVALWLAWWIGAERGRHGLARSRLPAAVVGTVALTAVLYAPVLLASGPHALLSNEFVAPRTWSYAVHHLPSSLAATFRGWNRDVPLPAAALLGLGFAAGVLAHRRIGRGPVAPALAAAVWILPVVVLQRVVPFERTWLFLLPLYLATAAAGLLRIARPLRERRLFGAAVAAAALAACAALAGAGAASRSVAASEDTSTFRDAPRVTAFLAGRLRPGDRVVAAPPADLILEYYLDRRGLDAGRILYADDAPRRLYAVVKEGPREYDLAEVLARHPADERRGLRPRLLRRIGHADVYELERRR